MKSVTYETITDATAGYSLSTCWSTWMGRLQDFKRGAQLKLAESSVGRIVLHLILAVMTCRFAWHFHGIARELSRS